MKRVDIIYFEASSGHKSAAEALRYGLLQENPDWEVRCVDLEDILRCQTRLLAFIYTTSVNFFNWCMRRESYFFFPTCMKLSIAYARVNTRVKMLRFLLRWTSDFWKDSPPDAVISVTPMKHTIVYEAARCINPKVHCITIPVDFSEMIPGYWYQPAIEQHYLVGSDRLHKDALASGVRPSDVTPLGGMIIDPRFYETNSINRAEFLEAMGLDPSLPTGVISFGGQGTVNVLRCAKKIAERKIPANLICLCGRNEELRQKVSKLTSCYPIAAHGFTEAPPVDILRMADFLIGKPGTMTLTESLITRTAFIFIKSQGLRSVQGSNEEWVLENGIGVKAETPGDVDEAVLRVLDDARMLERIDDCRHDGVYDAIREITEMVKSNVRIDAPSSEVTTRSPKSRLHSGTTIPLDVRNLRGCDTVK